MKTDETRSINDDETRYSQDSAIINDSSEYLENQESEEAAQPAKSKASAIGRRAAFAAGGVVAGAAVASGISAMASSSEHEDNELAKAATPDDEMTDEELANAQLTAEDPSEAPVIPENDINVVEEPSANSGATLLNPEAHSAPVHEAAEVQPQAAQDVNVTVNINGHAVEATPVVPEVEVHSIGQMMDAEGNVISHAEVTVDNVDATFVDLNNDGNLDVAVIDANNDGIISVDEIINIQDTGLTMDDVAMNMIHDDAADQLAMNDQGDFAPDMDTDF